MSTKSNISRRDFLKGAATLGAAAGAASIFPKTAPFTAVASSAAEKKVEWKASFCSGCHQPTCATRVKVADGVAVGLEGDPASMTNQGQLCVRGLSALMSLYNPYRVKAPMKRTNPNRGLDQDPGWVEISWEEALETTAQKLKEARDFDPRSFIFSRGFGFEETRLAFDRAFGTPNSLGTPGPLCPEHFTSLHLSGTMLDRLDLERCNYVVVAGRSFGADFAIASSSTRNFVKAVRRGMKVINVSPVNNRQGQMGEWVPIRPGTDIALGNAMAYVIVHELGQYDEWFLKVRTNAPYLIPDTEQYLKDTRVYMEDYVRDPETNKPLVWDTGANGPLPFDHAKGETYALEGTYEVNGQKVKTCFQVFKEYIQEFPPEWAEPITTVPAARIREIAANLVKEARIGSTIEIDGFQFPYRPACINIGRGAVTNRLGSQTYKAYGAINVMLGCIDVPGGMQGCQVMSQHPFLQPDDDGILKATESMATQSMGSKFEFPPNRLDMEGLYPMKHTTTPLAWKAMLDPESYYIDYPVKALMLHAANPVTSNANCNRVVEAWKKIPFIVNIAYHFDEPSVMSDIIMPEDHSLERTNMYRLFRNEKECDDESRGLMGTFIKTPAVERVHNTRNVNDIWIDLANRIGFLPALNESSNKSLLKGFPNAMPAGLTEEFALVPDKVYTFDEIVERKIKSDFGPEASFADFAESSWKPYRLPTIKESYNYSYAPENTVRLPLYYHRMTQIAKKLKADLESVGAHVPGWDEMDDFYRHYSGFPIWYEPGNYGTTAEHPFKVVNYKTHFLVTNTYGNVENPWLQEIIGKFVPDVRVVLIHPESAKKAGLSEGDSVILESQYGGKTEGTIHITNLVHPEVAGVAGNFGRLSQQMNPLVRIGTQYNQLLSDDESTLEPVMGALENSPRVRITKA